MVGLGAALARRNHRVSLVTNPYFTEVVESAGLEFLPISTVEDYMQLIEHPDLWNATKAVPCIAEHAIVKYLRPLYRLLEENYVPGETVLGAHALDAASRVLREKRGAPAATVTLAPQMIWSDYLSPHIGVPTIGPHMPRWMNRLQFWLGSRLVIDPVLKRPLDAFRAELDLPPTPRLFPQWWFTSDLNLCLFPEWFGPPQPDWPGPVETVGFPLWDGAEATPLSEEVEAFLREGEPPILFTPGTANRQAAGFFSTAVETCKQLGRRAILLTRFPEQLPSELPASIRHFEFVPLNRLLRRSALFVHHGGIGSCSQALGAGVPQLIWPLAFDQFDNAHRLRGLGVAEELRPKRFTVANLAAAIDRLTKSPEVANASQQWASRCNGAAALESACQAMERLLDKEE